MLHNIVFVLSLSVLSKNSDPVNIIHLQYSSVHFMWLLIQFRFQETLLQMESIM